MTPPTVILHQVARNLAMAFPPLVRWRVRRGRTAPTATTVDRAYLSRYAFEPFALLERAAGAGGLEGLEVGEIGPGDHLAVGLLALGAGARRYVGFDRFPGQAAGPAAQRVYRALRHGLPPERASIAGRLDRLGLPGSDFPQIPEVTRIDGAIERIAHARLPPLDVVFSYNVVEHIGDLDALARAIWAALRPGGRTAHRIDFGPHDVWLRCDDPFAWLEPSERLWRWMGSHRGVPSRARFHEVVDALRRAGFDVQTEVLERYDEARVAAARPRLAARFRRAPTESLAVKTAICVCRKPRSA